MATDPTATRDPQTMCEEQELADEELIGALDKWADADADVDTVKAEAKPHVKNVDDAKEARGIMRDFGDDLLQREYTAVVLLQKHLQGMLDQR